MAAAHVMVLLLTVTALLAQDPVPAPGERPRVLCGRKLADTRMLYCLSTKGEQKRSEIPLLWRMYQGDDSDDLPWVERRSPEQAQLLETRGKRMPGLVDECCFKPCYLSELLNYC